MEEDLSLIDDVVAGGGDDDAFDEMAAAGGGVAAEAAAEAAQPPRRVTRRRVAELAQRGRRVATWTGSGHRGEEGGRRRGVFSRACEVPFARNPALNRAIKTYYCSK